MSKQTNTASINPFDAPAAAPVPAAPEDGLLPNAAGLGLASAQSTQAQKAIATDGPGIPASGLTYAILERLAIDDPEKALKLLSLAKGLEEFRNKDVDRRGMVQMALNMAREVANTEGDKIASQNMCERGGHRRPGPNGDCAVGGQYDSRHQLIAICVLCHKLYKGVGNQAGQLPEFIYQQVNPEYIGG